MLLNNFPSIKVRSEKITGILFSLINLFFFARTVWQIFLPVPNRRTIIIFCGLLLIQLLFIILGLQQKLFKKMLRLLHLTGSPFILFVLFILLKRVLKPIIADQIINIRAEIGTWYLAIFLFLTMVILINFIRDLSHRAIDTISISAEDRSKSKFIEISQYIVILVLISYWIYTQAVNPLPIYSNYDPEFSYMLNSLTPLKDLELYGRMDHPGTFLQIAGSLIAIVLSPISMVNKGFPYRYYIEHPEAFIYTARFLILLLNIFTIRLIYKIFQYPKTWAQTFAGVSALIVYFSTHTYSFTHLTNWSPNSFNFAVGTFVLVILYILITSEKYKDLRTLWMASIAVGLAATFQVYMVTIIICTVSTIFLTSLFGKSRWKDTLKFTAISALGVVAGYITGTLVILEHYRSFLRWVSNIITHQGTYGSGSTGFATIPDLIQNNVLLWNENPALYIFWLFSVLIFIFISIYQNKINKIKAPTWAFIIGINLQIILLLLLFGKQPGHRYLLSIASVFPLILISIADLLSTKPRLNTGLYSTVFAGLVVLLVSNLSNSISDHNELRSYYDEYQKELSTFRTSQLDTSGFDSDNITYYWTYDTYSPCYSLWFGNDFSKSRFTDEILKKCPKDLQYDIWKNPLNELEKLRENNHLNVVILNHRNFKMLDDLEHLIKVESGVRNLRFIIIK